MSPTRIMAVQSSSTAADRPPAIDPTRPAPTSPTHNSETSAEAALATHPAPDPPRSIPPPPCPPAETASHRRSCSRTTTLRIRCKHLRRNISNIRSSYPPIPRATVALELSPQSSAQFLPTAGSGSPAYSYAACASERCGTTRTESAGTGSRSPYAAPPAASPSADKKARPPTANYRYSTSTQRTSPSATPATRPAPSDTPALALRTSSLRHIVREHFASELPRSSMAGCYAAPLLARRARHRRETTPETPLPSDSATASRDSGPCRAESRHCRSRPRAAPRPRSPHS